MLKLKNLNLKSSVFQSPMAGCTDLAFRLIAREYGMEMAYPEMISAEALVRQTKQTFDMMKTVPEDRPLGLQLVGSDPDRMAEAAQIVEGMGYDLVDVNIGCPVKKVTGQCAGSALLRDPDLAARIFQKMAKAVKKIPLSVKLQLGYNDPSGKEAIEVAQSAERAGFSSVAVHGRTRSQGYSGQANYDAIGRVKKALNIPVFGNGDVVNEKSARTLLEKSSCDGIMVGRGALGNPWIYKLVNAVIENKPLPDPPTFEEKRKALIKHFEYMLIWEGERAILKMRRVGVWYFAGEPGVVRFRDRIQRCTEIKEIRELIETFQPLPLDHESSGLEAVA